MPAAEIFKAYDIRGVVDKTLTEQSVQAIGQALGMTIRQAGQQACVVGRDGRLSGPRLTQALSKGLCAAGVDVLDVGMVPTPVVYFATVATGCGSGVAITGSHNPPQYNGLKIMVDGVTLWGDAISRLRDLIVSEEAAGFAAACKQKGVVRHLPEMAGQYVERIVTDIHLARPMKVVVDAGNGVAGVLGPDVLSRVGAEVTPLFCEIDGHFPNHHPDPAHVENLKDLITAVAEGEAELGLAFDGDGDRLGVVTKSGKIIWPDRQLMLYAAEVLAHRPGATIIFDVKCSRQVGHWVRRHGGVPLMWKTGHSLIKAKLKETQAALAGEMSGHIFFNDRWFGFDDGIYTAARLLEILSRFEDPSAVLEALPDTPSTPELQIATAEGDNLRIVSLLAAQGRFPSAVSRLTIDGIRVEYEDGFGLARPSNTTPVIVLRFEADNEQALGRIQDEFRSSLLRLVPDLKIPF